MLSIPGVAVVAVLYESVNSLVYRAIREANKGPIILKLLKESYPTPQELVRYRTEYRITQELKDAGVVRVYDLQKYQNSLVMFVEDFGGESLTIWMQQCRFRLEEVLLLTIETARSLSQIHAANVIHKDINPSNIVYNRETGQLKIIDFGISTQLTRENRIEVGVGTLQKTNQRVAAAVKPALNALWKWAPLQSNVHVDETPPVCHGSQRMAMDS
ncbi:protein kinase [Microcoleus sp. F8_C2]